MPYSSIALYLHLFVALAALLCFTAASSESQSFPFSVRQVPHPRFSQRNALAAYQKATARSFAKYGSANARHDRLVKRAAVGLAARVNALSASRPPAVSTPRVAASPRPSITRARPLKGPKTTPTRSPKSPSTPSPTPLAGGSVVASPDGPDDVEYTIPVSIGSQTFQLDLDTGSSDLWVFAQGSGVSNHPVYNPGAGAKPLSGQTFKISYSDKSDASGIVYQEAVTIGGITVQNQAVEAATSIVGSSLTSEKRDGIIGLGPSTGNSVTPTRQNTWLANAVAQGLPNVFAADLYHGKPGKYDFGALDPAYPASAITYTTGSIDSIDYLFSPASISVGSKTFANPGKTILDTGNSLILLPKEMVAAYYAQVPGSSVQSGNGLYVFPCGSALPPLTFTIGGGQHNATVPPALLNYSQSGNLCEGGLQVQTEGPPSLGDVFFKAQYVVFDMRGGGLQVGFADKADGGGGGGGTKLKREGTTRRRWNRAEKVKDGEH